MGLAPLQRTVPSPTLTTATGGFSSRLASRSARPLVQPLTHGVMHDAPAGHLDGVARPSAAAAPVVDAPAQPDLPLAGERVVAQRTAVVRRTALTAATATTPPGRRVRAVPAVQRTEARPEAATPVEARADAPVVAAEHAATDTPVVEVPSQVDGAAAPDGTTEPEIPGAVTHAPVEGGGLPPATGPMTPADTTGATSLVEASDGAVAAAAPLLGAMPGPDAAIPPAGTPHVARTPAGSGVDIAPARGDLPLPDARPGGTPTSPPSGSPPSVGAPVVGVPSSGSPSPGPPVAPAAPGRPPVQRATSADGPHPPRRSGLGAPLVSPVQRSARTGAPGARSGSPAPLSGLPPRESPATATPADAPEPGGPDSGPDGAGGGAAPGVSGPDVPTIGERTPPATLDVQRSARGDGADVGPASDAAVRPAAPEPEAAPAALPLQRTTGSAQGSGATPGPSPGDRQRSGGAGPGGSARAGGSPTGTAGAHEPGAPLPLQRARTAAGPHADTVEVGTPGTAPVVPGDATAPAGADASPGDAGAHVAAASPHLPPPLVPHAGAGMVTMPLLAQRGPLLQRMPAAGSDGEVDGGSPPPPGAAGPPSGGVARATQMSATVPSPRGGQGADPRGTHAGRTVQPLRRAGNGAGAAAQPPSPSATQAAASLAAPGSPGAPGAWASPGAPVRAGGEGSVAIAAADPVGAAPGSGGPVDGDAFAQTLMPGPRATRGPVTTAVAAGVQRLVARAARPGAARSPAPRADAAMTADDLAGGLAVGPSRPAATDAPAAAGAVDLAMPPVQLRPAPDGATAAQPVPMQTIAAPAPVAPAPPVSAVAVPPVQRAPEPVEVAGTPPSTAEPVAAVTAGAAAAGGSMPRSEEDLDVLAGRLYDHIAGRLRRELRVDRERTGLLTDLQG
jgi:hypothetical protein